MAKKTQSNPFQALEHDAYRAYREWPIWLVLRERELAAQLARAQTTAKTPRAKGKEENT